MKKYLKLEFKKNMFSWRTISSILIILSVFMIPYLEEIKFPCQELDGVDYFIRLSEFSYIGFIGPIIAGIIYSTSIINDKESGFINKLLEIIDIKTYFKVKLIVNVLINFIIFAISYGICILYLIIKYGLNNIRDGMTNGAFVISGFIGVYESSKILYIIIILLGTLISSVTFSTFVFGITTITGTKLTAYIFPIFYVILTGIFFEMWFLNSVIDFNVVKLFNLIESNTQNGINIILYNLILMILGVGLLYKSCYKDVLYLSREI
ncbi:hypothetical protein [Clostridium sp. ZBS15]|uniref:hypothetical protein n=1 Tax=Clostridium sp. ZBS15 TaxID=2949969 RepID=UPI00207AB191|nr:hypothetical protein [Clostridium sp. ZBS15]